MASNDARSFADLILRRVAATPDKEALRYPDGGGWASLTWRDVGQRSRAIACGLHAHGLQPEERAAILSATSADWILVDFGIMSAGAATTTIYPSNTPEECAYILADAQCRVAFVDDAAQLAKLASHRSQIPTVSRVVVMRGEVADDGWATTLERFAASGRDWDAAHPGRFEAIAASIRPDMLATLLYTSGTTGKPKGVELVHDCWLFEGEAIDALGLLAADDLHYLWLPLSHSFGKVLEAAQVRIGVPTAVDGRVDKIVDNLAVLRPTFVAGVPRIFEKVYNRVVMGAQEAGGMKLTIFRWALGVGRKVSRLSRQGGTPGPILALQHSLADKLVFSKLRERFGGRLRFFVSGSAPLSLEVAEFFHAAGILIVEGYGLTESSAATFVNRPAKYKLGTVGLPLPGAEVKIAREDGEILLRGRGIMRGYHRLPEATLEALDADGWLHTGDIGVVDDDGFLTITDRKKDLIKTSGGKYVAPQALEGRIKAASPYVSQVLVHGNNRNFCTALVTLDEEAIRKWLREHGSGADRPMQEIARDPAVRELIHGAFEQVNGSVASYETVKKFEVLPVDFTIESGELTASLKLKRKVVEQKYKDLLDGFYSEATVRV